MCRPEARRRISRRLVRALLMAWPIYPEFAVAQPAGRSLQWDTGVGYESQAAPVFQISPEGNILYLEGTRGQSGSFVRSNLHWNAHWPWERGISSGVNADANLRRSIQASALDQTSLSLQPSLHLPLGAGSAGIALNLQSHEAAGQHFRDTVGLQCDWTLAQPHGLWGVVAEVTRQTHPGTLSDLDATSASLVLLRQWHAADSHHDTDLSLVLGQERNQRSLAELSNRSVLLHAQWRWNLRAGDFSVAASWRQADFADSAFVSEAPRSDTTASGELAIEWPLAAGPSLRLEFSLVDNRSSVALYDNLARQLSLTLRTRW